MKPYPTPYWLVIHNHYRELFSFLHQFVCLCDFQEYEIERANLTFDKKTQDYIGYTPGITAIKTAMVLILFNAFESTANFFAELVVETDAGLRGTPKVVSRLSQVEIDLLKQQQSYVDIKTGKLKIRKSVYLPTLDKIALVPLLLARLHGLEFRLDKSKKEWRQITKLKTLRDKITHSKPDFELLTKEESKGPTISISFKEVFLCSAALRWYLNQINSLLTSIFKGRMKRIDEGFHAVDLSCWLNMQALHRLSHFPEKRFMREYPLPDLLKKVQQKK